MRSSWANISIPGIGTGTLREAEAQRRAGVGAGGHLLPHHCQGPSYPPTSGQRETPWAYFPGSLMAWDQVSPGGDRARTYLGSAQYG